MNPEPARPDVALTGDTYEPGHSSGWHVQLGMHAVVVVPGTLTVGGDQPDLVRYDAAEPGVYHAMRNCMHGGAHPGPV